MPVEEQQDRMRSMRSLLVQFNVYRWAGKNVGGRGALAQSGASGRTAGRALDRGSGGLTMQYLLSRASPSDFDAAGPGADPVRIRFRWDAVAHCGTSGPGRDARPDPDSARPPGGAVSLRHCLGTRPCGPSRQTERREGRARDRQSWRGNGSDHTKVRAAG